MAIKVNFYRFTKKENSTARPSGSGTELDCVLKDSSSIFFPVIKLNLGAASAPSFNYCIIPNFNRWYYITNWEWDRGLWYASLQVDVLATYKPEIGNSSLYALRASNSWDGRIVDNLYPTKSECTFTNITIQQPFNAMTPALGFFVIGIASIEGDFGSICYYAMKKSEMANFISTMLSDTFFTNTVGINLADASAGLQKSLIDPLQYIKSCIYIPLDITDFPSSFTAVSSIKIFAWDVPIHCRKVSNSIPYAFFYQNVPIPKHPQRASRGAFTDLSPYSNYQLILPPFGNFEIDSTALSGSTAITIYCRIDLPTGLGIVKIDNDDEYTLSSIESQIGVPIQLSQIMPDYSGFVGNVGGSIASAASGNIGGALMGLGSAVASLVPKVNTIGSGGSYAQLSGIWQLQAQFFEIVDDDINHNGRPLCQMVTPSSGYYLIQDGDVPIDGTKEEAIELKRYLEGGFYYE